MSFYGVHNLPPKILAKVKLYFTLAINQVMVKLVKKEILSKEKEVI